MLNLRRMKNYERGPSDLCDSFPRILMFRKRGQRGKKTIYYYWHPRICKAYYGSVSNWVDIRLDSKNWWY
jgi:hypothetical protein